ncbi:alpha/beta fold hydrolase [Glaciimonas sp. CA11.2]|uniref:thioesterase II family protein n=2 Tax=Glaciimonas sp. CA11.2 TaxID=3048601 RepID=UPI002AB4089D|nr:alpha/beta fold hydrolase [Glaciimonas sp. CA11.2]MDY7547442.1 alpha/beta fold hydrolase [Glaciimonas sp. CA11.2]
MKSSMTLFCLPHAGASANVYAPWRRLLPHWMTVHPVELPGRGNRLNQPLVKDFDVLVAQLADELSAAAHSTPRYALFGHSLGSLLAFELAYALAELGVSMPAALFVSGAPGPIWRDIARDDFFSTWPTDAQLMEELRRLNGMPTELLQNAELMEMVLPVMAGDFRLGASFVRRERTPLRCPIYAFGGTRDPVVSTAALHAWQCETTAEFKTQMFDGDHFFIRDHERVLLGRLEALSAQSVVEAA